MNSFSKIFDINLPLIIPKRNKGHHEVMCNCSLETKGFMNMENIVSHLVPLVKNTCFVHTPRDVLKEILKIEDMEDLVFRMNFLYHVDRASSTFKDSFYEMSCFYKVKGMKGVRPVLEMGVTLPIRVKQPFTMLGEMIFSVIDPYEIYFEDILDYVQKYGEVKMYPPVTLEDNTNAVNMIDAGKSVGEYMDALSQEKTIKKLGSAIRINITHPDVYNFYTTQYENVWNTL